MMVTADRFGDHFAARPDRMAENTRKLRGDRRIGQHEAKTHLSRLLERVPRGERIVISKAGQPITDLVPHRAAPVTIGGLRGQPDYDDSAFEIDADIQRMFCWANRRSRRISPRSSVIKG